MDDPWAVWSTPKKDPVAEAMPARGSMDMRMSMSPPPPQPDELDPWAPAPAKTSPKAPVKASPAGDAAMSPRSPPSSSSSALPKLGAGWDDAGWGAPASRTDPPRASMDRDYTRSPSPALNDAIDEGWGTPAARATPEPPAISSPRLGARPLSPTSMTGASPRASLDRQSTRPSPRQSTDAAGHVSRDSGAFSGRSSPPAGASATNSPRASPRAGPSAELSPTVMQGPFAVAFDTADLGAGFATPFGPSSPPRAASASPSSPGLGVPPTSDLRRTPSFGSDFGGFAAGAESDDDGAGGGWGDDAGWGAGSGTDRGYTTWGDAPRSSTPAAQATQEESWEAAQRRLAAVEARVPHDRVQALKKQWEDVAAVVIGDEALDVGDEDEAALETAAREFNDSMREMLRGMTEVPDTTFPFGASETRKAYAGALARATPNTTSLLRAPVRTRRLDGLNFGPGLEGWAARSRLGEPDAAPAPKADTNEDQPARGWGFWRRQPSHKPLVTSGGGILEVKTDTGDTSGRASRSESRDASNSRSSSVAPSIAPSVREPSVHDPSLSSAPGTTGPPTPGIAPSSIASPTGSIAPSVAAASASAPSPVEGKDDAGGAPAPSRMARIFGWGRKKTSNAPSDGKEKDLELGEDDFAFLDQVPSIATPGEGDLLGGGDEMAGLDMLGGAGETPKKKPAPLPSPLAPPPGRKASGPVARMAPPAARRNDMDLLAGLDFDEPLATGSSAASGSMGMGWDELLSPTGASASPVPRLTSPPVGGARAPSPAKLNINTLVASPTSSPISGATQFSNLSATAGPARTGSPLSQPPMSVGRSSPSTTHDHTRRRSSATSTGALTSPVSAVSPTSSLRYGPSGPAIGMSPFASPQRTRHRPSASIASTSSALAKSSAPPLAPPPSTSKAVTDDDDDMFGDFSSFAALTPSAPAQPKAQTPPAPLAFGGMEVLAPTPVASPPATSPPPTQPAPSFNMATLAPARGASPTVTSPSMQPMQAKPASVPSISAPAPVSAAPGAGHASFGGLGIAPPPAAPRSVPTTAPPPPTDNDDDDFGDFGDFATTTNTIMANKASTGDDFGGFAGGGGAADFDDFGDFASFDTPGRSTASSAPTPINKSIPPTPVEKSPAMQALGNLPHPSSPSPGPRPGIPPPPSGNVAAGVPRVPAGPPGASGLGISGLLPTPPCAAPAPVPAPTPANKPIDAFGDFSEFMTLTPPTNKVETGSSVGSGPGTSPLSRTSPLSSNDGHEPPTFARPAGLVSGLKPAKGHRRGLSADGSVDHSATRNLLAAAKNADAHSDSPPMSLPPTLAPPPAPAAGLIPPPPGRGGGHAKGSSLIDLLDD